MNSQALLSKGQWHQLREERVQWHQLQLACEQGRAVVLVSHHDHYRSLNRSKKKNSKQILYNQDVIISPDGTAMDGAAADLATVARRHNEGQVHSVIVCTRTYHSSSMTFDRQDD